MTRSYWMFKKQESEGVDLSHEVLTTARMMLEFGVFPAALTLKPRGLKPQKLKL